MTVADELELIAEAGDVSDVKDYAKHMIGKGGDGKAIALRLYRACSGNDFDRDAVRKLVAEVRGVEAKRAAFAAQVTAAIKSDPRLMAFAMGKRQSAADIDYVTNKLVGAPISALRNAR